MKLINFKIFYLTIFNAIILLGVGGCLSASNSSNNSTIQPTTNQTSQLSQTQQKFKQVTVTEGLERPWGMDWLPNGDLLVTERPGRLRIVKNGKLEPQPIQGVPAVLAVGQGGLLDVAVHSDFSENGYIYLTYSSGTRNNNQTRIARATLEENQLRDVKVIFEVSPMKRGGQHFGSRLLWLNDGTLLASIGDGGNPPVKINGELIRKQAQKLDSHLGKIIRINDDGSIPDDNPFLDQENANPAVWSYGHRNIQGLTMDKKTGQIWSTEHGSRGGDELNRIVAGENYGWPVVTHSREYTGGEISDKRSLPGMVDPLVVWTPAIAPSGLTFYDGDKFINWKGDLFAGGLVAREVIRIDLNDAGEIVEKYPIKFEQRVRDIKQSPDGFIYVLTDDNNGKLIRLEPVE
ncbi:PQQ-dependent sugar dehydrogenase [Crocosphaera sp.]|uniref:PQQ-dependent sugar dehydrogenase n=1 Tax=Crocosphaera sp. TaxID=2729996 RepID=UPI00263282E0|nr:PQQ-dependent sugar dehydrogenase [Crocosphaera sp.]MDJ0581148.1 PQQ-dependent sugar dehydrogenase [Crocosphaera sp.]